MNSQAFDPIALTVTVVRDEPLSIQVSNSLRPKGEWIPRSLIIDITREASDGTVTLTITRALALARGLI